MHKAALHLLIFNLFSFSIAKAAFHTNLCRLFEKNTTLRYPGIYNAYIKCAKNEVHFCDETNSAYDPNQGKCIKNDHQNQCLQTKTCRLMANPIDCSSFYFCLNGLTYSTHCEKNYHFDEEKQMCVSPGNSKCIAGLNNICKLVANGTRFIDPKNFRKHYECKNGHLYFNVELHANKSKVNAALYVQKLKEIDWDWVKFDPFIPSKG